MKSKYIVWSGVTTAFLVPLISFWIPIVGSMVSFLYATPLGLIGGMLGSTQQFVINGVFFIFPTTIGWFIILPFWFVIGALSGYILYKLRTNLYAKQGKAVPPMGISVFIVVIALQMIISFTLTSFISPFIEKEKAIAQIKQQQYYDQNCKTVYTKRSNYKILECPDTIVGSPAATTEYFSEKKK